MKYTHGFYTYRFGPLDFFHGTTPVIEHLIDAHERGPEIGRDHAKELKAFIRACLAAKEMGFDGEIRSYDEGCVCFFIPVVPVDCAEPLGTAFILKQDNNGTTFVMSPVELPHLDGKEC